MKKILCLLLIASTFVRSQTQVVIGPQSNTFSSMTRGYHFTAPVNFNLCALYIPQDASTGVQHIAVVQFNAGAPPAFPGTTNAFTVLFSATNVAPNTTVAVNIPMTAGTLYGIYGSRAANCVNSYDGVNYVANIMGSPTTLSRSGMQFCLATTPMQQIWSEVNYNIGRIFMYYNCCTTPTITTAPSATNICSSMSVAILGGGATSYTWMPGNINSPSITVTPTASTTYTLTGGQPNCPLIGTGTVAINVNPSPTISATNNGPLCQNQTINFTGGGGTTYTWTGPGGFSSNSQNPSITSASVANAGNYSLTVGNASGCTNSTITSLVVNSLPVIAVTNPTACVGTNINLSANGGSTYSWSGPGGYTSNAQNPVISNATTGMSGVYTVTVTSAQGCTSTANSTVTVITLPVASIANNTPCVGATLTFTGSGGANYNWSGPNGFTSSAQNPTIPNVSLAANGTYTLIVTAGSCSSSATQVVNINPLPNPTAANNGPVCENQTVNFTGGGGIIYTWSGPGGFSSNAQNPSITTASVANGGTYTVTVGNANGCVNSTVTTLVVNTLPVIAVTHPTVCSGLNINLSANGGNTYSWSGPGGYTSNVQNPVIANATMGMSGVYTVTVTSTQGCTSTANSTVTVLALPVAAIANNTPCVGATLTFTGSGGANYNWSGPNGFASGAQNPTIPNVSLAANGTYTLIVTAGTCSSSATQVVNINPLPNPTAANNGPLCENQTINLSATGGTGYAWSGPGGFSSTQQNPVINNASVSNAGSYTVVVTDGNSCSSSSVTTLVVNTLPVIAVSNPTVCLGQNINLTSNGGAGYSWTGPNGFSSAQQNPVILNSTMQMAGAYNVVVTSAQNCTSSAQANVTVLALPVASISSNTPCVGGLLQLTAAGGSTYFWNGPNGFNSASANPNISNITLAAAGNYTLVATAGNCTNSTTGMITINPLPTPTITGNGPVCLNQQATMNVAGGTSFQWSGPNGFTSNNTSVSFASAAQSHNGVYTATVTDGNGCSNSASYNLIVNPLPVIAMFGSTVCANQNILLSANGGNTFSWSGPLGFTSALPQPVIPGATPQMSGTYSVTVTDGNGCTSTSVTGVQVNTLPTPTAVSNSPICLTKTITLASGASNVINYAWAGPNGFTAFAQNLAINNAQLSHSGVYTVTATDNLGCKGTATAAVIVNTPPEGSVFADKMAGCVPLCVTFGSASTASLTSVIWDLGVGLTASGTSVTRCYEKDGPYSISAFYTDINGCTSTSIFTINVFPKPHADFNIAPQRPVENEQVVFTNSSYGPGIVSYQWQFSSNAGATNVQENPIMIFEKPGGYLAVLIVTNDKGCTDTTMRSYIVGEDYGLYVPEAFTPNGDGINDVFFPKGFGIVTYEMNIFNRWGEKLFTTTKLEEGWNGNYVGRSEDVVEDGVYVWHIKLTNVFWKSDRAQRKSSPLQINLIIKKKAA